MPLFDSMSDGFRTPFAVGAAVGDGAPPKPEDGRRTRAALDLLGYRRDAEGDGGDLFDDLRDFQKDNGLEIDGVMNPGGPTEKTLGELVAKADPADAPRFPQGDTVDRRIRSLMEDSRYPSDARLRKHVERQFETAYPGALRFDVQGRMERPLTEITPSEVSPFDPRGVLAQRRRAIRNAVAWKFDPADYTGGAEISVPPEETNAAVRDAFREGERQRRERAAEAARNATPLPEGELSDEALTQTREAFRAAKEKQDAAAAWEKGLLPEFAGGDRQAFEAAARRLGELREKNAEAYGKLSADTRAVHRAYETSREAYEPIKKKALELGLGSEEELNARFDREAFEVAMHVGALRNADGAIKEPLAEVVTRIGQAMDLVNGEEPDYAALQKRLQNIRESVPKGYKDSPVYDRIRDATDLAVNVASWAAAPAGAAIGAAEVAEELRKRGASLDEQRIGAVVGSLVGRIGKGVTRTGVGAAESALARGRRQVGG